MGSIVGMRTAQRRARSQGGESCQCVDAKREACMTRGIASRNDGALQATFPQNSIKQPPQTIADTVIDHAGCNTADGNGPAQFDDSWVVRTARSVSKRVT